MAKCPECGTPDAYVGFLLVECLNPQCKHYVLPRGTIGQAFLSSSPLTPEIKAAVDELMDHDFPEEVRKIQNAVGAEIPVTMDFRNVGGNLKAFWLLVRVLGRVRSTLCLRSGQYQEALREGIKRVAIRHVGVGERKSCTLANGVLDLRVSVDAPATATHTGPGYDENDLDRMVADALDLELGPAVRKTQEWLLGCIDEFNERHRLRLSLDVDWRSFTSNPDNRVNLRVIDSLRNELHTHILYWLNSHTANNKEFRKQLKQTLHSLRLEHVTTAAQRELFVDGASVVYKICLTEDGGAWGYELGDVLQGAVMNVQPPPPPELIQQWLETEGKAELERITKIKDSDARRVLEDFVRREMPVPALWLQRLANGPATVEFNWEDLSKNLELLPHLGPRVLNKIRGAMRMVASNPDFAALLQTGSLRRFVINFADDPTKKSCDFNSMTLTLAVSPAHPGTGCFDENEIAAILTAKLGVESRLVELREKEVKEYVERLCEKLGSLIEYEVDWAGFLSHPDPGKNQFALMQLREVGLQWVYYALTGQADEDTEFREKLRNRVRAVRFVSVPNSKDKNVTAEGATFVYRLQLHNNYDGYIITEHLKEIFAELVETMPPDAPPCARVTKLLDQADREFRQAAMDVMKEALGKEILVTINCESFGNNLIAARNLKTEAIDAIVRAVTELGSDKWLRAKLNEALSQITIINAGDPRDNRCVLENRELIVETYLGDPHGSDALSSSDIYNVIQEALREEEEEEEESDDDDRSNRRDDGEDPTLWFSMFRTQILPQYLTMLNQMNASSVELDGDWMSFEGALTGIHGVDARVCLETCAPLFFTALVQNQMINPAFGAKLRQAIKKVRLECAGPHDRKELRMDGDTLVCSLQPADGFAGGFDMMELSAKLPGVLGM